MMFTSYRSFNLCFYVFILTFLSSTALFCNNLTSTDNKDTPCFLVPSTSNPVVLRTSSNTVVLPCHVARSKRSIVEWWYNDPQKMIDIKIYPVYPPVRPTVLRFVTSLTPYSKNLNETDIIDASILLPYVNVDDSGTYRCVIRPWAMDPSEQVETIMFADDSKTSSLHYNLQLTGPRLCHASPGLLPCFTAMRTSSPTIVDAYQTAFLQCVVKSFNRPVSVFWVVGNASVNSLLITNHLPASQYNGDRLRRVFPRSLADYSIELTVDRNVYERVYSCVIDGATDMETSIFTYIVRTIDLEPVENKTMNGTTRHEEKPMGQSVELVEEIHFISEKTIVPDKEKSSEEVISDAAEAADERKSDSK